MALTTIAPIAAPASWATIGTAITFTALNADGGAGGLQFACNGRQALLIQNVSGTTAFTITITSQPDTPEGRTADLTLSIPANGIYCTQMFPVNGWVKAGYVLIPTGQSVNLQVAVLSF